MAKRPNAMSRCENDLQERRYKVKNKNTRTRENLHHVGRIMSIFSLNTEFSDKLL